MAKSDVNITPLGRRVVVKVQEVEAITKGGLIIPPTVQEDQKSDLGRVVKLGIGEEGFKFSVKEGDMVFFKKYSSDQIIDGENEYLVLEEENIFAIVR